MMLCMAQQYSLHPKYPSLYQLEVAQYHTISTAIPRLLTVQNDHFSGLTFEGREWNDYELISCVLTILGASYLVYRYREEYR